MSSRVELPASQPSALGSGGDEKARARARIGMTINNKWRLDALLGVGGMASVYAATHRNGSRAALKILHTEFARDPGIRDRFLREGYVANRVEHRGRVAIQDDDVTEQDEPFLVMELLEGETAQQLWKRKNRRMAPAEALWISAEVLDALDPFHKLGIVHRDIKPANIFVTKENVVKVLDFGVARMREAGGDKTRAGTALGTPSFMAPEQAMGLSDGVDGRADVFSVGAMLYAMLSGQRLHQGRTDNEAFILAATTPAPSLARIAPDLPVEVISLVDKALAWDQRNRFETAAIMREECLRIVDQLGGVPGQAKAAQPAQRRFDEQEARRQEERVKKHDAAAMPIVEEMKEEEQEDAEADEPSVVALVDTFRRLERLLPAIRHYGWSHPEADNKLRATYQGFIEALRADPAAVRWRLSPYSFTHRGQTVWEPQAPLDAVPYHLFAAGIRKIDISPGFSEEELRHLCEVMLLDPTTDLAPEDDVAAALWEKRLDHVHYDVINVFAEGDAADREAFWAEADDVEEEARRATEERANRAEAAAMVIETDAAALKAARQAAAALALDPVAKKALGSQLAMTPERWSERFVDVITDAILNARRYKDSELVYEPLDASTRDLVLQRRFDIVFSMFDAIAKAIEAWAPKNEIANVKAEVARGMFLPETFRILLKEVVRTPGVAVVADFVPADLDMVSREIMPVVSALGPSHLEVMLDMVSAVHHEGLRRVLFGYLERILPGREAEIVDRVMTLDIEVARPILRILAAVKKPSATEALRRIAGCVNPMLRCEAIALLSPSPEQLKDELAQLAETGSPELRIAALRTLAFHQVKPAGPLLVRRIQEAAFHQLAPDERKEILGALFVLHPLRGEQVSLEILEKRGLFSTDDNVEQTRVLAAELLGRETRSMEALQSLVKEARRRWGNSPQLREKAGAAAEAIAARLGRRITESGDIQ
jgi:eukaryotic-like serine/threonine-protein kinase